MQRIFFIGLTIVFAGSTLHCGPEAKNEVSVTARVMTYNVLCSFCDDAYDPWEERLLAFKDIFERHDPDLIGLQELTFPEEVTQLLALKNGYAAVFFVGEEAGPLGLVEYPDATIFYRTARFELLEQGFYWLSPTPDVAWSSGFADGLQFPRIVAWARFLEITSQRQLFFATTHFDNNPPSQDKSAPLLLERTEPFDSRMPIIISGDFNSQPYDPAYKILVEGVSGQGFHLVNAFDLAAEWSIDTNQVPAPDYDVAGRIDHLFVAGQAIEWVCPDWTVDMHVYGQNQMYPSDHLAITSELVFTYPDK